MGIPSNAALDVTFPGFVLSPSYQQLCHAYPEIGLVEFVRDVPAERAKLSPFLDQPVKEAETKEKFLPIFRLEEKKSMS